MALTKQITIILRCISTYRLPQAIAVIKPTPFVDGWSFSLQKRIIL
jgi:hypothetical protein